MRQATRNREGNKLYIEQVFFVHSLLKAMTIPPISENLLLTKTLK